MSPGTLIGGDLTRLLTDLILLLGAAAAAYATRFIKAHTTVAERQVLADVAQDIVALLASQFPGITVQSVVAKGVELVTGELAAKGIRLGATAITAALTNAFAALVEGGIIDALTPLAAAPSRPPVGTPAPDPTPASTPTPGPSTPTPGPSTSGTAST